jgi:hypothetical protein
LHTIQPNSICKYNGDTISLLRSYTVL